MKILAPISPTSEDPSAAEFCAVLAPRAPKEITLLTVVKRSATRKRAEAAQAVAASRLVERAIQVESLIHLGHPAEEIIRLTEERPFDLIVMGTREHHDRVSRFLVGSTALRVVEHASLPVVLARGTVRPIRRILLCESGQPEPGILVRFWDQLGGFLTPAHEVTVLHVMSQISAAPGIPDEALLATAAELIAANAREGLFLERDIRELAERGIQGVPRVRHGGVVEEILAEAAEGDYDLLVIGAHQGTGWRRILLDDLAHRIIVGADRPILVVR